MTQLATIPAASVFPWDETRVRARPQLLDLVGSISGALMLVVWISIVFLDPAGEREGAGGGGSGSASIAEQAARETVVSGYVGGAHTHPSDVRFLLPGKTDLTVHGVDWIGRPFKSPIYYGLRAVRWTGATGTMLDFTHSKAIAPAGQAVKLSGSRNGRAAPETGKIGDMFKHLEFSHGHNMLTVNRLFRLSPSMARIGPYVGGGAGVNLPHTEIQFLDEPDRTYEYQYTGPTGQVLAGVELRLPRVSLFFEYKLSVSHYTAPLSARDNKASFGYSDFFVQLAAWWRGEKPKYGTATTWIVSHNVVGGAGGRFVSGDAAAR